jgi:hypothetical protein
MITPLPVAVTQSPPPGFPLRPVNGGPLPRALPKSGLWGYEPKVNGWRAWVHCPTRRMFNRHNEPLSITAEFTPVLNRLHDWFDGLGPDLGPWFEWLDTEAFARRHALGRGSLVLLDAPLAPGIKPVRDQAIYDHIIATDVGESWAHEQFAPPENALLSFAYHYEDEAVQRAFGATVIDPDLFPLAAWTRLQACNRALQAEVFEGLVAKRLDSTYPLQQRSADQEFPFWMKHRWAF